MKIYKLKLMVFLVMSLALQISSNVRGEGSEEPLANHLPEHFRQLSPTLFSGATPKDQADFKELHTRGIRTIVSVDGAAPKVEEAKSVGLRYIHLPIGYSGVSPRVQATLKLLLKEVEGPIYIHCHHGLHRGPTVAALTAMMSAGFDRTQALAYLESAGTGKHYRGLWAVVSGFNGVPSDVEPLLLLEKTPIADLTASMVETDNIYDRIKHLMKNVDSPAHSNDELLHQCTLLAENFRESSRHVSKKQESMKSGLKKSEKLTLELLAAVEKQNDQALPGHLKRIKNSCVDCHTDYRN